MSRRPALYELTVARMKEFLREPEAVFWVFFFPLALAVALGFAFREKPPDRTPIGVVSGAGADAAAAALGRSPLLLPRVMPEPAGREALRTGKISLLVEPGPPAVFHFDETRPDSRIARLAADDALQRGAGRVDRLAVKEEKIREPGARYIDFLVPGLLGMNLMSTGVWSIAFGVTTARNRKLLKRLLATPMRKSDYLLSHMLSRLVFLVFEVVFLIGFGWIFFGVAVRGSVLLLLVICLISALSFCGLGLLVASRVSTVEGASGLANLLLLPMWIVSGVFFSSERFPDAIQPLIRALPLTAVNEALRGVINEAQGIAGVAPQMAIVLAWGLVSFAVALKIFRWK
jgi:ABC-type multidrug transport system permease subunit